MHQMLRLAVRELRLLRLIVLHQPAGIRWVALARRGVSLLAARGWAAMRSTLLSEIAQTQGPALLGSAIRVGSGTPHPVELIKARFANVVVVFASGDLTPVGEELVRRWKSEVSALVRVEVIEEPDLNLSRLRQCLQDASYAIALKDALIDISSMLEMLDLIAETAELIYCNEIELDVAGEVVDALVKPGFSELSNQSFDYLSSCFVFDTSLLEGLVGTADHLSGSALASALAAEATTVLGAPHTFCSKLYVQQLEDSSRSSLEGDMAAVSVDPRPLVSVVIPTRDRWDLLGPCLASLEARAGRVELEYIVIDNGSTDPDTCLALRQWEQACDRHLLLQDSSAFNWSKLNNAAARLASGSTLLFLNNDTEVDSGSAVETLYRALQQKDVGICGARLLYPDKSIQHAGVVLGFGGAADHVYRGSGPTASFSPFLSPLVTREVSAVTGAALMIGAELFRQLEGFDESYSVTGSDIDLCIRAGLIGKKTLYCAGAIWTHYESKSRSNRDPRADVLRLKRKIADAGLLPDQHYSALFSLQSLHPLIDPSMQVKAEYVIKK